jgi:tetratricopeptide (TPR) repeat protein
MKATAAPSRIEAEVLRIRALMDGRQFASALGAAQNLLAEVPENRDLLYMAAVCQRFGGRVDDALATLARLERAHPTYSRLFQERGHCQVAARDPGAALEAYRRAVNLNAALPGSWKALEVLYRAAGRTADAASAAAEVAKLASLPAAVVTATSLFADGELPLAERVLREFLRAAGNQVEAMRLLAQIDITQDALDEAEWLLDGILRIAPDHQHARLDLVRVLLQRQHDARALEEAGKLLAADSGNRDFRAVHATALVALGRDEEALREYRALVAEAPQAAELHLSIAHALKTLGRRHEAIDAYRHAAAVRPGFGDAYWSLANLKTYRFADAEIARMRLAEADAATAAVDRYHLCFALGKALEDQGEFAESFAHYARGNALKKAQIRYEPAAIERAARRQMQVCTRGFLAERREFGCPRPDPIFIVGLPRAGSTLLEQILASHSLVEGTRELADIPRLVNQLQGRLSGESAEAYPRALVALTRAECARFGAKYLADTAVYRAGARHAKPFFIDKMPNNFRHLGLIHLILPKAKIIDARREPMACCFSNYKQLFASGQEFSYAIEDIARYYRSYVELMDHWNAVLPGRILQVRHEEVVRDLEGSVRRLLAFCELDFEPACLEYHKTGRSVRTASSEQVRRPIYPDGVDQWRRFEPWLGPLRAALGPLAAEAG